MRGLTRGLVPLLRFRPVLRLYNAAYERAPRPALLLANRMVRRPKVDDYHWTVRLANGRRVRIPIGGGSEPGWAVALEYRRHAPGLNRLEAVLCDLLAPDAPYLDIGANRGLRSLTALSTGRPVFMFEPNARLNAINRRNCEANGFDNAHIVAACVSDAPGSVDFYFDATGFLSTVHGERIEEKIVDRVETVPAITLDAFWRETFGTASDALIKIDAEWHERAVISGGREMIQALSPTLIVEVQRDADLDFISGELLPAGYRVWQIDAHSTAARILHPLSPPLGAGAHLPVDSRDFLFALRPEVHDAVRPLEAPPVSS